MRKSLRSEQGFTLIELMLTLVIASFVSALVYAVFISGVKLFDKIQVEGQMRDDADYIATMILNEMYENDPEYIQPTDKGLRLFVAAQKAIDKYLVEDKEVPYETVVDIYFDDSKQSIIIERVQPTVATLAAIQLNTEKNLSEILTSENIETETITVPSVNIESSSTISLNCQVTEESKCYSGRIEMDLELKPTNQRESVSGNPLLLTSSFGF